MARATVALWAALFLAACDEQGAASQLRVELIRADGENAAQRVTGTLVVEVHQGGEPLPCADGPCESPITAGDFDLVLPLRSLTERTEIQAEILGGDPSPRLGALPSFTVAGEGLDMGLVPVRLVMEPPATCAFLDAPPVSTAGDISLLSVPRRDAASVVRRNVALIVGGVGPDGDVDAVDMHDQIVAELRPPLSPLPSALGAARGLALSEDVSLALGARPYLFSLNPSGPPIPTQVALHAGAGFASTLIPRPDGGVVLGGDGADGVSWLGTTGAIRGTTRLVTARAFAAAASLDDGVLVVGGSAEGAVAEWLPPVRDGQALDAELPEGAAGGWLLPGPDGASALWVGFAVDGVPARETYRFEGCPACTVRPGPEWARPRAGASALVTATGTLWIVGGDGRAEIDLVSWDGTTPRIVEGPSLQAARSGAAVFEQASGIVTVAGGEGPEGLRDDLEHCTPLRLDPL